VQTAGMGKYLLESQKIKVLLQSALKRTPTSNYHIIAQNSYIVNIRNRYELNKSCLTLMLYTGVY
jgi:hypothetical protein